MIISGTIYRSYHGGHYWYFIQQCFHMETVITGSLYNSVPMVEVVNTGTVTSNIPMVVLVITDTIYSSEIRCYCQLITYSTCHLTLLRFII